MRAARWRCALRCSYALPSAKAYDVTAVDGTRTNWHSPSRVDPTCRAGRWHRARSRTPLTRRCCGWWSARPLPWSARTPEPKSEGASPRSRERAGARSGRRGRATSTRDAHGRALVELDEEDYRDALDGTLIGARKRVRSGVLHRLGGVGGEIPSKFWAWGEICLLYTSPSPRDRQKSRMPSSA